ncbi:MAG: hypothetical protein ACQEVA_22925 [Myxococcota bacterium]
MRRNWLQVGRTRLVIEFFVVAAMLGGVAAFFWLTATPVWVPAAALWSLVIGFVAYRVWTIRDGAEWAARTRAKRLKTGAFVRMEAVNRRAPDQVSSPDPAQDLSDTVPQGHPAVERAEGDQEAHELDDQQVTDTLFDVPSIGETSKSFENVQVVRDAQCDDRAPTLDEESWQKLQSLEADDARDEGDREQ